MNRESENVFYPRHGDPSAAGRKLENLAFARLSASRASFSTLWYGCP
jgi:hypothetical protein